LERLNRDTKPSWQEEAAYVRLPSPFALFFFLLSLTPEKSKKAKQEGGGKD